MPVLDISLACFQFSFRFHPPKLPCSLSLGSLTPASLFSKQRSRPRLSAQHGSQLSQLRRAPQHCPWRGLNKHPRASYHQRRRRLTAVQTAQRRESSQPWCWLTWWPVLQPSTFWWVFHPRQLPHLSSPSSSSLCCLCTFKTWLSQIRPPAAQGDYVRPARSTPAAQTTDLAPSGVQETRRRGTDGQTLTQKPGQHGMENASRHPPRRGAIGR